MVAVAVAVAVVVRTIAVADVTED
jgi:peptide deformylase